jgi:hypothetical protein
MKFYKLNKWLLSFPNIKTWYMFEGFIEHNDFAHPVFAAFLDLYVHKRVTEVSVSLYILE